MNRHFLCVMSLVLLGIAGCNGPSVDRADRKLRVVATTGMISDLVQQIGGDRVEVRGLMGPGVDPHLYQVKPSDEEALGRADLVFYNGLHLEGKMGEVFEQMSKQVRTAAVASKLDPQKDLRPGPEGFEGSHDPHIWFDVRLWMKAAECVRDTLIEFDPTSADKYRANADRYLKELGILHDYVKRETAKVPPKQRVLITAHDAFYYFGHAYNFEVKGLQGVSTATEPSPKDVRDLAQLIADRRIPALFVEDSVPERNLKAVQDAVRARGFDVRIGGKLYSDSLGDPKDTQDNAGTYIGMVRYNTDTIVRALASNQP